jgi:hypothetical protein
MTQLDSCSDSDEEREWQLIHRNALSEDGLITPPPDSESDAEEHGAGMKLQKGGQCEAYTRDAAEYPLSAPALSEPAKMKKTKVSSQLDSRPNPMFIQTVPAQGALGSVDVRDALIKFYQEVDASNVDSVDWLIKAHTVETLKHILVKKYKRHPFGPRPYKRHPSGLLTTALPAVFGRTQNTSAPAKTPRCLKRVFLVAFVSCGLLLLIASLMANPVITQANPAPAVHQDKGSAFFMNPNEPMKAPTKFTDEQLAVVRATCKLYVEQQLQVKETALLKPPLPVHKHATDSMGQPVKPKQSHFKELREMRVTLEEMEHNTKEQKKHAEETEKRLEETEERLEEMAEYVEEMRKRLGEKDQQLHTIMAQLSGQEEQIHRHHQEHLNLLEAQIVAEAIAEPRGARDEPGVREEWKKAKQQPRKKKEGKQKTEKKEWKKEQQEQDCQTRACQKKQRRADDKEQARARRHARKVEKKRATEQKKKTRELERQERSAHKQAKKRAKQQAKKHRHEHKQAAQAAQAHATQARKQRRRQTYEEEARVAFADAAFQLFGEEEDFRRVHQHVIKYFPSRQERYEQVLVAADPRAHFMWLEKEAIRLEHEARERGYLC